MKNLFMSTSNNEKEEIINLINRFDINNITPKKEKKEFIPKNELDLKLSDCNFKKLKAEMEKYEHPPGGNAHHRAGVLYHSVWSTKAAESLFYAPDNNWIKKKILLPEYKNFTILAAFLHDIGKLDGKTSKKNFVKPKHDKYGYNLLINSCSTIYEILDKCIHPKYTKNVNQKIAFLAIIIKHHLDLGDIMQGKLSIDKYIDNIFESLVNFPSDIYIFMRPDVEILIRILTIVQLCDVVGARPFPFISKWKTLNELPRDIQEHEEYLKNKNLVPWIKYGYEKNGEKIVDNIIKVYQEKIQIFFNSSDRGVASKLKEKIYKLGNLEFIYSEVPAGVYFFKAMNVENITEKAHESYKNISWFGSESTADGYLTSKHFGGFQYQFQTRRKLKLLRLDNNKTIISFYALLHFMYQRDKHKKYLDIANKLQFAFGVGKKQLKNIKQHINKKFFNFNESELSLKRISFHEIDIDIMNQLICPFSSEHNFDGYIATPMFNAASNKGNFHEEIALCKPWEDMKFIKLYKKFDFKKQCRLVRGGKGKISQEGGALFTSKKNITLDKFIEYFDRYFDSPKELDIGTVNWTMIKPFISAISEKEKFSIYKTSYNYLKNKKTKLMLKSQIYIICYSSKYYFLEKKIEDIVEKTDLRTNKPYSKNILKKLTTDKKQILDFVKGLYKAYDNEKIIKNIKKGYKILPKYFFGDNNKNVIRYIYSRLDNPKRGFENFDTLTRHKFFIWCDKAIKEPHSFLSKTEKRDIIATLVEFYFERKVWSEIEGEYDLIIGDSIDVLSNDSEALEYLKDVDVYGKTVYKVLEKLLPIPGFNAMFTQAELDRKKKIAEAKEKMKKQSKEENKRAKEAAKKQAEKQKNRKNNKFCKNEVEFITQEDIEDIPTEDLVFIKFNGSIFCLDKDSFKNMIKYAKDQKVRGNCKPAIRGKPLECDMYYPINIGQNVYISEDNYKILEFALKKNPYEQKQYELKNKRIVDFTTGLHMMSEKSGKDAVYDLVPSTFEMEGGSYEMEGGALITFSKKK